ncbi:MAG: YicC/YloC family endoribonuclease [Gemmatimonadota bacterium]
MTGFGDAEVETEVGVLRAEIRTVNHRFFSLNVRSPAALDRYEPRIREWLKDGLARGHINLTYRLEGPGSEAGPALALDAERARQYLRIFRQLRDELELTGDVTVDLIARQPDLVVREQAEAPELPEMAVHDVTRAAVRAVVAMREAEGQALRADLEERLDAIGAALIVVAERAPERLVRERDRLRRSVTELAADASVDEDRLAREVAILADRWDIGEEIVRLRSHIDHFRAMLEEESAEPVGKRLSFLVQEMHREANTIGAKANDSEIEHRVVAIKNEIERLREQVENVE